MAFRVSSQNTPSPDSGPKGRAFKSPRPDHFPVRPLPFQDYLGNNSKRTNIFAVVIWFRQELPVQRKSALILFAIRITPL